MLALLAFLPLLGGYIAVNVIHYPRIQAHRADGYRLIILAFGVGFVLYILASLIAPLLILGYDHSECVRNLIDLVSGYVSVQSRYRPLGVFQGEASTYQLLVSCVALTISGPLAGVLNLAGRKVNFFSKGFAVEKAITKRNDPMEIFLNQALRSGGYILVTLTSGKVYVGSVIRDLNPIYALASVELELFRSGYRSDADHKVNFTTDYDAVEKSIKKETENVSFQILERMVRNKKIRESDKIINAVLENLHNDERIKELALQRVIVIPYREIQSVHPYSQKVFDAHQKAHD